MWLLGPIGISTSCLRFRLKYPTRTLVVPSAFLYHPSKAPVTLAPESRGGSRGRGVCPLRARADADRIAIVQLKRAKRDFIFTYFKEADAGSAAFFLATSAW